MAARVRFGLGSLLVGVLVAAGLLMMSGVAGASGGCPNEQLRVEDNSTLLPDCRAYEMVTPPYKEGPPALLTPSSLSSDGDGALLSGVADLAGALGQGMSFQADEGGGYRDVRTASGWSIVSSLNPSAGEYVGVIRAAEPGSGASLWEAHTLAQSFTTRGLYVRSATGGAMTLVGPVSTPAESTGPPSNEIAIEASHLQEISIPVAATSDYAHVIIEPHSEVAERWPSDKTQGGRSALYEYSGVGNSEPTLVSVKGPRGSTDVEGFECGAVLGSGRVTRSTEGALSSDGETVFFTPVLQGEGCPFGASPTVTEVWARVHGSRDASLPAETVDVSARSASECTGPCASSPESGKNFEGASEDGNLVFFTSTQQLTNAATQDPDPEDSAFAAIKHPFRAGCRRTQGPGGCNLYVFETRGRRLRLVAGGAEVLGVSAIARDGSRVYFVARGVLAGAGPYGATPQPGEPNLYVYDTGSGQTSFIATLGEGDREDWQAVETWRRPVEVTGEPSEAGRFLLFPSSKEGLTPDDRTGTEQLFEYDAKTAELVRVTQGENGYADDGNDVNEGVPLEWLRGYSGSGIQLFQSSGYPLVISRDGRTVMFTDEGRLSAAATSADQGCWSVYEYRSGARIGDGGVHLISDGVDVTAIGGGTCGAEALRIDPTGDDILFQTGDPLLSSDVDGFARDTYDARVDGGFPAPRPAGGCVGEGCLGRVGAPPSLGAAGSAGQVAEGVSGSGSVSSGGSGGGGVRSLSRAQQLARALVGCGRVPRARRASCRARARARYGPRARRSVDVNRGGRGR